MKKDIMIRFALPYSDNSGERMSLEIDTKETERFVVKINGEKGIWCSLDDLFWLKENIERAIQFIHKEDNNV